MSRDLSAQIYLLLRLSAALCIRVAGFCCERCLMKRLFKTGLIVIALALPALAGVCSIGGCSKPCDDLAYLVCSCQYTSDMQNACIASFINGNPVSINGAKETACVAILKTCNCATLLSGDYASCGLSNKLPDFNDGGISDGGNSDAGAPDAGIPDAGTPDAGTPDAG
jgi:hypothetical protein